ncbi:DUF1799 domain-containing protein [Methyloversatilis sp.]|uniref:DUF1799 domain-containing protein n=1 Tax=Methyloversatilis sp. TaxID=2569862 RepID=UPI003D29D50A
MGELGLTRADFAGQDFEVWPENWTPLMVFGAMKDQWRVGPNGPYALDYAALPEVWRRCHIAPDRRDEIFDALQEMVPAALQEIRRRAKRST